MTRLLIVGHSPAARARIRALLQASDLVITGETPAFPDRSSELGVDVDAFIICDADLLPSGSSKRWRQALVVIGSGGAIQRRIRRVASGGWAVVSPDSSADDVHSAITAATRGMVVVPSSSFNGAAPRRDQDGAITDSERVDHQEDEGAFDEPLTPRELQVLRLLSRGLSNHEIAEDLGISDHTVKFHVSTIYSKLGVATRTAALRTGLRRGLIEI
jgi:DNA-binding NarL/FixJ family response regulator